MLKQRSLSAIVVVAAVVIPALFGGPVFAIMVLLLGLVGLQELLRAFTIAGARPFRVIAFVTFAGMVGAVALDLPFWYISALLTILVLLPLGVAISRGVSGRELNDWALTVAGTLYVALPLAHFIALRDLPGHTSGWLAGLSTTLGAGETTAGLSWFALALSVTWLTDTAAYLVGRQFGKTKLIPAVSPGKTREGAAGGLVAGTLAGAASVLVFATPIPWYLGAAVGLALAGVGQIGDLAESLIKREVGIKDMGSLIPGHGGVLDRIDALLFAIPTAYYLARLFGEVRWS
ncbi:phosphatidate cytidylyltransferase [Nitrolancea hollandica]|uniref:Phosphatidate cytidylyltransferase n=1 Tax=Nitrolancea hollandica Lb TaxID=1129897 RepID=I4EFJ3_9BACT|nr:phosphatidate cytidylyltransferase [Nitrolancea hollandica]CCF83455.1 Phosphatidate cytidylyltransferase [Nitrolancea hollandica Lb]